MHLVDAVACAIHGRRLRQRGLRSAVAATAMAALLLPFAPHPASAAPTNPSDQQLATARAAREAAAAEVGRIAGLAAAAETELQRVTLQAQAAADAQLVALAELEQAKEAAAASADALRSAERQVESARGDVAALGRATYMRGQTLTHVAALVNAEGPTEMLERAATLEFLGEQRTETLRALKISQVRRANADSSARATLDRVDEAEQAATAARVAAEQQLAETKRAYEVIAARKSEYGRQLRRAQIRLLRLQGERDAYRAWRQREDALAAREAARAAEAARRAAERAERARRSDPSSPGSPSSGAVAPTSGIFTTCYEMRWGVMHYGVDIAAPIGTPVYSPIAGRVVRAGPATGFGLAVYIQHDDGSVTVYGHINDYFVSAGQRVAAGQVVAEVGNKGQSTGPHLHFEVHADGMYQGRTNPIPWLAARGVDMGGRCR